MTFKKIVGITGGIGSGKTFVCQILETMGYPVFYSDKEAKEILISDTDVKAKLIYLLGESSYLDSGHLNKQYLAQQIFNNKDKLEKMNTIVHPVVRSKFLEWVKDQKKELVFNEAAILFETGIYKRYDSTILITADKAIKIKRLFKRDNSTISEIEKRMNNQWSDAKKKVLASYCITNNEKTMLIPQINTIITSLLKT